jgi:HEAT repeat protein
MNKPTPLDCLLGLLQSRFRRTRAEVLDVLGDLGDESLVSIPIQVLQNDVYFDIRCSAASALGKIGGPKAVDALILALKDYAVLPTAAHALAKLKDERSIQPLIVVLENSEPSGHSYWAAAEALANFGEPAVSPLIKALEHPKAARLATSALYWMGDKRAIEPMMKLYNNHNLDEFGRLRAVEALAPLRKCASPIDCLLTLLSSRSACVRDDVLEVLGVLENESLVGPVIRVLKNDRQPFVRVKAAETLARLGGPKSIDALILALKDKDVFYASACALGSIGDERSIKPLMKLTKNHSLYQKQRIRAAETLSRFKTLQVVEFLKRVMNDQTESEVMRSFVANCDLWIDRQSST